MCDSISGRSFSFIGVGNMAGAILRGMEGSGIPRESVCLYDTDPAKYIPFEGCRTALSVAEAVRGSDYIFLAVKPQVISVPLGEMKRCDLSSSVIVSIAAGVPISRICSELGRETACIRTMPNTPLMIGRGVTALARNSLVSDKTFEDVKNVFAASGSVFELPESKMNAVISATSSAPAYIYLVIKAIADSAEAQGLNSDELLPYICDMVAGSAELLKQSDKSADELIRMVMSPGGTTERAMKVLYEKDLAGIIDSAMKACTQRASELSGM